jgi:two-component system cell cycle sensor histidine kinase/response regulator CckA
MKSESTAGADPIAFPRLFEYYSERSPEPTLAVEGVTHIVRYSNPAFSRLAGTANKELLGRPFAEAVPENSANDCSAMLERVFRTGVPERLNEQLHNQAHLLPVYWSYSVWAILGEDRNPVGLMIRVADATEVAVFRTQAAAMNEALIVSSVRQHELIDTIERGEAERRELELKVFQARKLESLGVLAGGIAHDLNNILTPILGYAQLATELLPVDSPARSMVEEVGKNARRAADLVLQILAFAGKGRFVLIAIDLSALVRELDLLLKSKVSAGVELRYDLDPSLLPVRVDPTQIRQVVINLVANASEALPAGGGTIVVRTGSIRADGDPASSAGPCVYLEVTDTGCGMSKEAIENIFDPFFTTKFTGRGLGLSIVQGIARGHSGTLEVKSELGKGSSFRLILPSTRNPVEAAPVPKGSDVWRGTGTILVVDDEKGVRDFLTQLLVEHGFEVQIACDGREGVRIFREGSEAISAVLLDLTMPGMDGLETAEALRRIEPDLPIILMSGYSIRELTRQAEGIGNLEFVQKPFTLPVLLGAIRQALTH